MSEKCCRLNVKIRIASVVLSEQQCGIPDSELIDVLHMDWPEPGMCTIVARFCPWCGKPIIKENARITPPPIPSKRPPCMNDVHGDHCRNLPHPPKPESKFEPPEDWTPDLDERMGDLDGLS